MKKITFPYNEISQLSDRDIASQMWEDDIKSFHKYEVEMDSFEAVILDKSSDDIDRQLLVDTIHKQSKNYELSALSSSNITALKEDNTFTIITAHQPSFLTGPLYFIHKIVSVIKLTRQLSDRYTKYNFVPIFVIGGEDHDFEEVNHVHLFNNTYKWESGVSGAVGRMPIDQMEPVLKDIYELFGKGAYAEDLKTIISASYSKSDNYTSFTLMIVYQLFTKFGLVCCSMDDSGLKEKMIPIFREELLQNRTIELVKQAQSKLISKGYKAQVHARKINLFYLNDNNRRRIIFEDGVYKILKSEIKFTEDQILQELENHPERFSPNVILRPLYQERIFPNLAYVGGGGELAYWMELRSIFDQYKINFPMLVRRDSVLIIDNRSQKLIQKVGFDIQHLFVDKQILINGLLADSDLNYEIEEDLNDMRHLFERIKQKAMAIDPSLKSSVESMATKQLKLISGIGGRMKRAAKSREEIRIKQLEKLLDRVHPHGKLQERYDNIIPFYLQYGPTFIDRLLDELDPMDKEFKVITL